ncbi:unnamed protein product [Symbiodinium natans]|uniref:Uncharacterized protein n=1 Tax=Symbiodinium natans TaxID=878477 RepID=A0A812NPE1_9DINO|nr:unnamed protein product [Symbiodinium natans]
MWLGPRRVGDDGEDRERFPCWRPLNGAREPRLANRGARRGQAEDSRTLQSKTHLTDQPWKNVEETEDPSLRLRSIAGSSSDQGNILYDTMPQVDCGNPYGDNEQNAQSRGAPLLVRCDSCIVGLCNVPDRNL